MALMTVRVDQIVALSRGAKHEFNSVVDHPKAATYDWGAAGWNPDSKPNSDRNPGGMREVTGYNHSYNIMGKPVVACQIYARYMQTWVRKDGVWSKVEDQTDPAKRVSGAYYQGDMAGPAKPFTPVVTGGEGKEVRFPGPPATTNCHFWLTPRGSIPEGCDATVWYSEVRIDNPAANVIMGGGTDWWKVDGGWPGGNAASLTGTFIKLTDQYRPVCCTNLNEDELTASHPPIVTTGVSVDPPVEPPDVNPVVGPPGPKGDPGPPGRGFIIKVDGKMLPVGAVVTFDVI